MTIPELLIDLEAKAKQARLYGAPEHWPKESEAIVIHRNGAFHRSLTTYYRDFIVACSPDRILRLIAHVRELEEKVNRDAY